MAVDLVGATVDDRYYIDKKIQSGFYGATWLSNDLRNNSAEVCLKTFFYEGNAQKELAILKEMATGKFLHDNLCTVLHVSVDKAPVKAHNGRQLPQSNYVVFEYCSGTDLFNFLVTGPFEKLNRVSSFPEPLAQHYFTQALLAVAYLHERGVFHRDIKPENCVLDGHFNLKLTDFGTNKMIPVGSDPSQVLRTATKGIGTDSYRAPEVNGVNSYDPSLADVWSLGVTLFFMVAIDEMVGKVKSLDSYTRQLVAPLGIVFPFPLHCSKLDCYMSPDHRDKAPPNLGFWSEWSGLSQRFSRELMELFNSVFHLKPNNRTTIRELAHHPWISTAKSLSPQQVLAQMQARCPSSVSPSHHPRPKVQKTRPVGGVDQATFRTTLTSSVTPDYLTDCELWMYSQVLYTLEETQLAIIESSTIEEFIMDLGLCRQVLRSIASNPQDPAQRSVQFDRSSWVVNYLTAVGFLPQGSTLYLPEDSLNLPLLSAAAMILDGLEEAVFKCAVEISMPDDEEMGAEIPPSDIPEGAFSQFSVFGGGIGSGLPHSQPESSHIPPHPAGLPRRFSSDPSMETNTLAPEPIAPDESSQSSMASMVWSAQSSQEDCPEDFVTPSSSDYSNCHRLLNLGLAVDISQPRKFKSAALFCKLSGLLTSYGLYQVVLNEQLALYSKGSTASFSARIVLTDYNTGAVGISSWCFSGPEEWLAILSRVSSDMTPASS